MDVPAASDLGMTALGWVIFIFSNSVVLGLTTFCFYRVLTIPQEHMRSPLDIDTKDTDDEDEEEENNNH